MYRNKRDVDKHVENLLSKLSIKEFKTRAYSVARLYYEVGDYPNCQKYVEQYLTQKDNNAAAYKLLGQALQKLGHKEKALEQYKTSLDIDPAQTGTILDICELLADDDVVIEPGRAKYWCEKANATFPRHPVTFRLREKLATLCNPDPEALVKLLTAELEIRPKDALLHARLLKHYLNVNQFKKAFEHACNIEFSVNNLGNNWAWYEILLEVLNSNVHNINDWLYQLLLLTVKERMSMLSLTETPSGFSKSLPESNDLLHAYDQALESVAKAGPAPGYAEFHTSLLQHHRGQFAFHAATFLLKKAKKDQLSWRDATKFAAPLILIAWHTVPLDPKVNWLRRAPERQHNAVNRWYSEGTYRCSQSGHYLLSNFHDKSQSLLDQISQCCSGTHWRDKLYEKIFSSRSHLTKIVSSHFVTNAYSTPVLRLPRKNEVEAYDNDAQKEYGNSLHHFVWMLLNYKNYAHFKCTLFEMLTPTVTTCGPETLNKHDVHAFLYCAALTADQQRSRKICYISSDKPIVLPANITDLLCPLPQIKWWDCAYKFSQNGLGTELTDIRATLSRGIEVVRCIDSHGLDPELLCILGRIFSETAKLSTNADEKAHLEMRAALYYNSAIPILAKLKNKIMVKILDKRMFDYTHKELGSKELNSLIEESKLYVAMRHFNDNEYDKVLEILTNLKTPQAYYHLSKTYKKIALEEYNLTEDTTPDTRSKYATLLSKAKSYGYKALDKLKDAETSRNNPLYTDTQELIEDIEVSINKIDPDLSSTIINDVDGKYFSDDNVSGEHLPIRTNIHALRNLSSTPKSTNPNMTNYRTAVDSQVLDTTRVDQQFLERIENEIKNLNKRDTTVNDFMEQTRNWFDENRKLGNQIMSTIHSNIQNTTDQFKLLKISLDQVKDQIDECRNECKDVGELKKQIAELKKEVNKLKKPTSEQTIDENELYNLDEDYRTNDNTSTFATQLPPFTPQVMPPFNQRVVPPFPVPNPYQLYGQSIYNLYNQYSQFAQPPNVPGAQPMFDPTRSQMNYSGMYTTPDQMYLDVAHLVPSGVPAAPAVPAAPVVSVPLPVVSVATSKSIPKEIKEIPRSLPVNVVITSSDPLPTCTTAPAPVLSVTIPPKHIKTPHNYQIAMPSTNETKVNSPPVFSFTMPGNETSTSSTVSSVINWNQSVTFKTTQPTSATVTGNSSNQSSLFKIGKDAFENSKTVVDGVFSESSPNTSLNKSRTLSERSNTSVENYDPCPDFKPIVPLPAEVKVTTGEEDETVIFSSRAKLFRFVDKQWKERGIGDMKLLKHKLTGKVRVLMRREQIHKICANHIITNEMEIKSMMNETKAYFWVANDFADETVVLEKFCIRFKTADIAKDFYNTFEKARQESTPSVGIDSASSANIDKFKLATPIKDKTEESFASTAGKSVIGGFTFSSAPTFKPVLDNREPDTKPPEQATGKVNVFSNITFNKTTSSPFSNLFNVSVATSPNTATQNKEIPTKLNASDTVEEFEPNVEFKPVIPLPALVDQKTGEEDETILFEHRAKLLRFDVATKEWKERGLGNIKLLVHKDNVQKVRLLMRREQIMKVCCNHAVTKEMIFQKMPNVDKAVTWCAKDFSEGELVPETFCLRFKTVQLCDDFIDAVISAQSKLKDESKAAKEEQNAAKQNNQSGFGDKFKSKPGSWHCDTCYTNNLESFIKCACCEEPRPGTNDASSAATASSGWGDTFKPKPGSWECKECFVRNDAATEKCSACNSPKDPTTVKSTAKLASDNTAKFSFGIPGQTASSIESKNVIPTSTLPVTSGWGDQFKPKEGTWECKQCFVRNKSNVENCIACNKPKNPPLLGSDTSAVKFRFGVNPSAANDQNVKTETTSIFDGTGTHKFNFGIPSNVTASSHSGDQKATTTVFSVPKASTDNDGTLKFSLKTRDADSAIVTPVKAALLPTPQTESAVSFVTKENVPFNFVFKPKTPTKGKSPAKSPKSPGDDSDGHEYASDDDSSHIHFSPVVPMPDKVEVVTGEENECELYGHRAKLYRFTGGEWKERGIGVVKILKHNDTGKLRVVMRREQVLKICLNHALAPEISYTSKDEKTWLFAANDFSEGELSLQQFCLRFASKDVALEFKEAIDNARQGKFGDISGKDTKTISKDKNNEGDDVVFVNEIQATTEEKQKAKELMLPENFFTYKNKESCRGCRGCKDDDEPKSNTPISTAIATAASAVIKSTVVTTPLKTSIASIQSPTNSLYGTPTNFDKTFDTSIFRTPLGSIDSATKPTVPTTASGGVVGNDATNKENTFIQKPSIFSGFGGQKIQFGTPQGKPATLSGAGDSQTPISTKSSVIAPPKLSSFNIAGKQQGQDAKSIFAAAQTQPFGEVKSVFGNTGSGASSNKSIFDFSADNKKADNQNDEVKSIFGGDAKPVNLFSGTSQGSIFGPGSLTGNNSESGLFGSTAMSTFSSVASQNEMAPGKTSLFGDVHKTSLWKWAPSVEQKTPDLTTNIAIDKPAELKVEKVEEPAKTEIPFKYDNSLTFEDLSSSGNGATFQKKEDFRWEGAGQKLFVAAQKTAKDSGDKSTNESGAGDDEGAGADEEYDPHYEPIVPLPDKIVVTTGEEDEEKIFGERCKLYRYDDKSREWKERGVGEMKILYHSGRNIYRLLLRREQVHKAVLNMLLFMDLELLPMKNSDRAWTWVGLNHAETAAGEKETLAVRFKSIELANNFHEKVIECVRKLQAAAAKAIQEEKAGKDKLFETVAPLRLPKHLESSARADTALSATVERQTQSTATGEARAADAKTEANPNGGDQVASAAEVFRQVHFREPDKEEEEDEDEANYDYDENDYDAYYNEEDEDDDSGAYYSCDAEAVIKQGHEEDTCEHARIIVTYDEEMYSPKIIIADAATGEVLTETLIHTETEFQMSGDSCTWSGTDYTSVAKTITVNFYDSESAMRFYDSCETSKAATYSSTDPET